MNGLLGPLLGLLLAAAIVGVGHFYFHVPEGTPRGLLFLGAVVVWAGFSFGPKLWRKLFGA